MSVSKLYLILFFLLAINLFPTKSHSDESGNSVKILQKKDRYLCENSHLFPKNAMQWQKREHRGGVGISYEGELKLYRSEYGDKWVPNMNSLVANRMVHAYGFDLKTFRKAAASLGYARNGVERYAFMRLLVRQKVESIILGMNEAIGYLRVNPSDHSNNVEESSNFFGNWFSSSKTKKVEEKPYLGFKKIPSVCIQMDPYVEKLQTVLFEKRREETNQINVNPQTGAPFYKDLPADEKIYSLEKNAAITSLQTRLRKSFIEIQNLHKLKNSLKNDVKKRLDLFRAFLDEGSRLANLARVSSIRARSKIISETVEFYEWKIYMKVLFADSSELRESLLKQLNDDYLATSLKGLPYNGKVKKNDWKVAYKYLDRKMEEIDVEIDAIKNMTPILVLDYNSGVGTDTLYDWLDLHREQLTPQNKNKFCSIFDQQIQKALSYNFLKIQIPALKRTCNILKMKPAKLVCPESSDEIRSLINNQPVFREILKSEKYLSPSAYNFILDDTANDLKDMKRLVAETAVLTVATLGVGTVISMLANGSKIATLVHAARIASSLKKAATAVRIFTQGEKLVRVARIARTGLNFYLFANSLFSAKKAYGTAVHMEQDAHSAIETPAWGSLQAAKNAWFNFYVSAGIAVVQGGITHIQLKRFIKNDVMFKNGVAYIKSKTPPRIVELLKSAGIRIRSMAVYKVALKAVSGTKTMIEAFRRTLRKAGEYIDVGSEANVLKARVVTSKSSDHFRAIKDLVVSTKNAQVPAGTAIIKDGVLMTGWTIKKSANGILFISKDSGQMFTLSSKLFTCGNLVGNYAIYAKSGSVWIGITEGLKAVKTIPKGTEKLGYAIMRRGLQVPVSMLKILGDMAGSGVKVGIGMTVITAAGVTLWLEAVVNKGIVGAAKKLESVIPVDWKGVNEGLTTLIGRLEPKTVDQTERQAKIRELTMQHQVRGILDNFQIQTNILEDKLFQMEHVRKFIYELMESLKSADDIEQIRIIKMQLKDFLDRQNYYTHSFFEWRLRAQRYMDYDVEKYVFYHENADLFDRYWDYYYSVRKKAGYASDFSKESSSGSATFRFGIWVTSYPSTNERTEELQKMDDFVKEYQEEVKILAEELEVKYGIVMSPMVSGTKDIDMNNFTNYRDESGSAKALVLCLKNAEKSLREKEQNLNYLISDFDIIYGKLLDSKVSRDEGRQRILSILERLYTLRVRDFYQWRKSIKDRLETMLFQYKMKDENERKEMVETINKLSNFSVELEEDTINGENVASIKYGLWYASTSSYEDTIKMKELDVKMSKQLESIEKKVLELKKFDLIDTDKKINLTDL